MPEPKEDEGEVKLSQVSILPNYLARVRIFGTTVDTANYI